nr:MAG TPA: hypothetical protein [Caudoviricetes sp.]
MPQPIRHLQTKNNLLILYFQLIEDGIGYNVILQHLILNQQTS